jgi:periplasmic divalent cation tolerance protein
MIDATEIATTTDSQERAEALAKAVQQTGKAACIKILGPFKSLYQWKGSWELASEYQLVVLSLPEFESDLKKVIRANHAYEVPEIIARTVSLIDDDYALWLLETLHGKSDT